MREFVEDGELGGFVDSDDRSQGFAVLVTRKAPLVARNHRRRSVAPVADGQFRG